MESDTIMKDTASKPGYDLQMDVENGGTLALSLQGRITLNDADRLFAEMVEDVRFSLEGGRSVFHLSPLASHLTFYLGLLNADPADLFKVGDALD